MIELNVELKATDNSWMDATLSVYEELIMLHSACISAQWPLNDTGVQLTRFGSNNLRIGFWHTGCSAETYQSFIFNANKFLEIEKFFKDHHFPVPRNMVMDKPCTSLDKTSCEPETNVGVK